MMQWQLLLRKIQVFQLFIYRELLILQVRATGFRIVTSTEVAERARDLVRATDLPVLVDIDTGFGGVLNVARTAVEMVEAKVAAVQIEDQQLPKKCGHLNGKKLVTTEELVQKIKAIKEVAPSLYIVAHRCSWCRRIR